jgi:hypothetical protein
VLPCSRSRGATMFRSWSFPCHLPTVTGGPRDGSRPRRQSRPEGPKRRTPAATPAAPRTRNPPVTTIEKNRGIFSLPGSFSTLSGTKLSAGARSSTRNRRSGPHYAGPDQARHSPRITTPSRHRATSTTATDPPPGPASEPPQQQRTIVVPGPGPTAAGSGANVTCRGTSHGDSYTRGPPPAPRPGPG